MLQKPEHFSSRNAKSFRHQSVVESYRYRPPYPVETFDILAELIKDDENKAGSPRCVLDAGCGCGNIARSLVERVEWLDAVDFSQPMIEKGKSLPNGDNPRLHWLYGRIEEVALNPPYGLVTAGESLHWMDWNIVLPRFREMLVLGGYLALVGHDTTPDPWSSLGEIITNYRMDGKYLPQNRDYKMLEELERHGLFQKVGEKKTEPQLFEQSIDDYVESYHSRSGFSRERMGAERAAAFDQEARKKLSSTYSGGVVPLQVVGSVAWGIPGRGL